MKPAVELGLDTGTSGGRGRYLLRLRELASTVDKAVALHAHEAFEAEVRLQHGRKSAFWAHVNGKS